MNRYLKLLCLCLAAGVAANAAAASSASATDFQFHSEGTSTVFTGAQHPGNDDIFIFEAGMVSCGSVNWVGSQTGSTNEWIELIPTYTGCVAFGFINTLVHVNGCKYRFTSSTIKYQGPVHIICPTSPMEITAAGCTVTVGSQTPEGGAAYTNVGSGTTREVTIDIDVTGLSYIEHETFSGGCADGFGKTKTNGTYGGAALVTGETSKKAHLGIWVG